MNVIDIRERATLLFSKYEKYLGEEPVARPQSGDPFMDEYLMLLDRVQDLTLKAEAVAQEKNRALRAALNAEIRKDKMQLLDTALPRLVGIADQMQKGSTAQMHETRMQQVKELAESVDAVADGMGSMRTPGKPLVATSYYSTGGGSVTINPMKLDGRMQDESYYQHTDATAAFASEAERAARRQDMALERIENGLGTLKELGQAMGEEIERHDVLIDEVSTKMDTVTTELKNNNARLKGLVTKVRSSRNYVIDVILICVLLAIGLYIYLMLR